MLEGTPVEALVAEEEDMTDAEEGEGGQEDADAVGEDVAGTVVEVAAVVMESTEANSGTIGAIKLKRAFAGEGDDVLDDLS